jgi:peptidoglycan/xylan/chitin deacetylase (PgdA/CDA1 family)
MKHIVERLYIGYRKIKHYVFNVIDTPIIVLLYHRVTNLKSDPQLLAVTPENFKEQLLFLKDNFPILRTDEDWSGMKDPAVIITFDDGYVDNFTEALPILESLRIPATFFICTGNIGTNREFWWDELERIILLPESLPFKFDLKDPNYTASWTVETPDDRMNMYHDVHILMKKVDVDKRNTWLHQLRGWSNAGEMGRPGYRSMTIDELQSLKQSEIVTIGAHTVGHPPLSSLTPERQQEEIFRSKQALETWLNCDIRYFSYPFGGKHDYDSTATRICQMTGFTTCMMNKPGQIHQWTNRYELPRYLVRDWDIRTFKNKISEYFIL